MSQMMFPSYPKPPVPPPVTKMEIGHLTLEPVRFITYPIGQIIGGTFFPFIECWVGLIRPQTPAERVVEAAREFIKNGTTLTSCSRGMCQRVIEYEDKSDPQYQLMRALSHLGAQR